jgi:hypothetical protein
MAIRVEFKKTGDWDVVENHIKNLDINLKSSITWGERKVGEKLVKIVKNHIKNQDLDWDPLAESTLWKKKGNNNILRWTDTYLNSIKTWQIQGIRYVGVERGVTHPINGEEIAKIANIHEFRSYNGGPNRALWMPSLDELGGKKGIRNIIMEVIYKKLKNLGYPITIK